jgi:hypothetical protein
LETLFNKSLYQRPCLSSAIIPERFKWKQSTELICILMFPVFSYMEELLKYLLYPGKPLRVTTLSDQKTHRPLRTHWGCFDIVIGQVKFSWYLEVCLEFYEFHVFISQFLTKKVIVS